MFELLGDGIVNIVQWKYLIPLFIGCLVGVVGGALPGITITMTVIVVLPFTFAANYAFTSRLLSPRRPARS